MFKHKIKMAVKTITVTEDAYDALKRLKHEDESFSEVIKRTAGQKMKIRDLWGALVETPEKMEAFAKRVKEARKELGKGFEERMKRVHFR